MKDFFKNKRNIILVSIGGAGVLCAVLSTFVSFFVPVSCILLGLLSLYIAWIFLMKMLKDNNSKIKEFESNDDPKAKKRMTFLESESKTNKFLMLFSFALVGVILVYYGIKMFM